ncbi:MAG TPA: asparagine synthase-related protein [Thermoleophilaceae bacterium]|nr:asparagine synthase-related protein [Thermoleophilaceae bacterium]
MSRSPAIVQAARGPELSPLDIAAGQAYGEIPVEIPPATLPPLRALELSLARALERPPCVVAFSGGRDSSVILCVAARVAREEGLDAPIAVTHRFRDVPATFEDEWQELVLRHAAVSEWVRLEHGAELDMVGPVAARVMEEHGRFFPAGIHAWQPLFEQARGGTLVNGMEGDVLFGAWWWAGLGDLRARRRRPRPRDLLTALHAHAPDPLARAAGRRRNPSPSLPWLTETARRRMSALRERHLVRQPVRFDAYVRWAVSRRVVQLTRRELDRLAAGAGASNLHPFQDPAFLAGLAAAGGRDGFGDRTATTRHLFGGDLPDAVVARPAKVLFDGAFLNDHSRALAPAWDGQGFDPELVRAEVLREEWRRPVLPTRTALLLQDLWLRRRAERTT